MDAGASSGASADTWPCSPAAAVSRWSFAMSQWYQYLLDKSNPYVRKRWIAFATIAIIYVLRVVVFPGLYLVSYALRIYILNLLNGFLSLLTVHRHHRWWLRLQLHVARLTTNCLIGELSCLRRSLIAIGVSSSGLWWRSAFHPCRGATKTHRSIYEHLSLLTFP
ncbi:hypothetical protein CsSME_00049614 [Camellia sinensis var. sinensis]